MALLPEPRLRHLDDQTGLTVFQYDKMAPGRQFCDVVLAKARFELTPEGISRSARPAELCLADTHRNADDPLGSSLAQAGDLIVGKPGADIYVSGLARRAQPARYWAVSVTLGPQAQPLAHYECAATGPRHWRHSLLSGWQLSETEPTQAVPIEYELSYGGSKPDSKKPADEWQRFEPNPSGTGFSFDHYPRDQTPAAPQWESASVFASLKSKELVGLGPVARFWTSRKQFIGTYDEAWQREQLKDGVIADYPADFDLRFFQCATPSCKPPHRSRATRRCTSKGCCRQPPRSVPGYRAWRCWLRWVQRERRAISKCACRSIPCTSIWKKTSSSWSGG
ncbi:MAG: DUF2169 domain-containing protein [Rhodoferax sp.]|nr:DUF2169 domain-containing protein [Rhodoferax sp.]